MIDLALLPALATAFFAGLLGAGHCFGMCGAIAGGFGAVSAGRGATRAALVFNGARLASYAGLGALAAGLVGLGGEVLSLPDWGRWLRALTAVFILVIGLRFLFDWQGLAVIERAGAGLWRRLAPGLGKAAQRPGLSGQVALGLGWGLLPCGMVYTVLLTAASTGSLVGGAAVMLAFGLGTLPALLGLTLWSPALSAVLRDPRFRRWIGAALVLLAAWSLVLALGVGTDPHHHH